MNGFQNPYMAPYGMNSYGQMPQQAQGQKQVDKVNGRNGALSYTLGPNSSAWVLDESGEISWLIMTDGIGCKTVTPYDVAPHKDKPAPDFGILETRIAKLEEIINGNTGNITAIRKKPNGKPDDGES